MLIKNPNYRNSPAPKKVIGKMFWDTRKVINVENIMTFIGSATLGPYFYLTTAKSACNTDGVATGVGLAIGSGIQMLAYSNYVFEHGSTKILLIPAATNAFCLVGEWYQYTKRKIIEKRKNSGLEEVSEVK